MTKDEIFEKLQTEVTIRGLSPGTYYTYKRAIDLFLNWTNKPYEELEEIDFRNYLLFLINRGDLTTAYEELEEIDFRNYLLFLINRGDLTTATINMYNAAIRFFLQVILEKDINYAHIVSKVGASTLHILLPRQDAHSDNHGSITRHCPRRIADGYDTLCPQIHLWYSPY